MGGLYVDVGVVGRREVEAEVTEAEVGSRWWWWWCGEENIAMERGERVRVGLVGGRLGLGVIVPLRYCCGGVGVSM